ncbi:MAG: hypothetical protein ABIP20_17045 [Chthoniobacteraceae bacterium]
MGDDDAKAKNDSVALAVTIDPLVQNPARWVIQFYWVLPSASLALYLLPYSRYSYGGKPPGIELGFYPVFFITGLLLKSLLWRKLPEMFRRLVQLGTLRADSLTGILGRFQRRLDHPLGNSVGIVFGLAIVVFYFKALPAWASLRLWPIGFCLIHLSIVSIDVLISYTIGVAIWKLAVTAQEIRGLAEEKCLELHPFHPDRCQGLSPVGSLTLAMSQIMAVFGFFFLAFIIQERWLSAAPSGIYRMYEPWFLLGFAVTIVASVLAFVWPLLLIHRVMQEEADRARKQLDELALRISQAEQSLIGGNFELGDAEMKQEEAKIAMLKRFHESHDHVATWPIDTPTYYKFLSAQIPLWLGVVTSVWNLLDKARAHPNNPVTH